MVLAVNGTLSPSILFLSNDIEIRSSICEDKDLSEFELLFAANESNILNQLNGHVPRLAVIDSSIDINWNIEITNILKQRYNIPVILLIDPDDISHLEQATRCEADSIFTKPLQPRQLAISIQFYLLKAKEEKHQFCMPRRCNVVTQHAPDIGVDLVTGDTAHLLDKQDFILKLKELIAQTEKENTANVCVRFQVHDNRVLENSHWKKESLNLINRFTRHIQKQIRYGDILAKDTGYQYLMLLPDMDKYTASIVIERINTSISELISSFDNNPDLVVSAGAAVFDHNSDIADIMDNIDSANNEASKMGNGAFIIKSMLDSRCEKNTKKVSYANVIQNALKEDAFFLHYQPIISLWDNTVKHHEALIRLHDNNGGYVSPRKIISAAENNHQIKEIDIRILDLVMRKLTMVQSQPEDFIVSVNISGTHFGDESLLQDICILIDYYGINPSQLVFEMTETAAVKDLRQASRFISRLKDLGCRFGLDDFGTGYASFSYLRALPVDYLKIDGTFVKEIIHNPADQLFVKAIVDVARGINIKTIAECVEDRETLEMLTSFGVDFAQGYFIGRPQPLAFP